jgi:molybdopterin-containing oxidoreductase family iron-sulfur binding subunit
MSTPSPVSNRVAAVHGRRLWRSLEEFAASDAFIAQLREQHPAWADAALLDRRGFLRLAAASMALAGFYGCSRPPERDIVPSLRGGAGEIASNTRFYATALPFDGYALGVHVETNDGRPTKIEGNPAHPATLGATGALAEAAVLDLWDPDRSQSAQCGGDLCNWDDVLGEFAQLRTDSVRDEGAGLRILTGATTSPTLIAQMQNLLRRYPRAQWICSSPLARDNGFAGARLAFGRPLQPVWHFDRADVVLSLDSDFLSEPPGHLRYARDFAERRRVERRPASMNRLYVVESTTSLAGSMADHRLPLASTDIERFARALARRLGIEVSGEDAGLPPRWLGAVAGDLQAHRGRALIVAGDAQPPFVHALVHACNAAIGALGTTVDFVEPIEAQPGAQFAALRALSDDMRSGRVHSLLVLGANPVYDAPADCGFTKALKRVRRTMHAGLYFDETAAACRWHVPLAHPLEHWSDLRAYDGSIAFVQPTIAPLYGGRDAHEIVAAVLGDIAPSSYAIVRGYWQRQRPQDFEAFWTESLRTGVVAGSAAPSVTPALRQDFLRAPVAAAASGVELLLRPDPMIRDGRHANNGWLQELPRPATQLTWDNALLVSPDWAARMHLRNGDEVRVRRGDAAFVAPVWILPGQATDSITASLGHGRRRAGRVGTGIGFDAYALRDSRTPWRVDSVNVEPTGRSRDLASTQVHFSMDDREPVRSATLAEFERNGDAIRRGPLEDGPFPTLYPRHPAGTYAWGMAIDLNVCIGCKACSIACQAENNIPVVGKEQVRKGREMHWIRVDRYYDGAPENPRSLHQPVPCMHCEDAPCELVCPVDATVHDSEGLNVQVYNRCVGTRFCSNNCPYKVRRFNFLQYSNLTTESLKGQRNPDVTVRNHGVMEKCTYCVQRIREAHIEADKRGRPIADGEVRTACQNACPTRAIHFGDLNDPRSRVNQAKASPLNYVLLADQNTRPRTTYLARLRNPNPQLDDGSA